MADDDAFSLDFTSAGAFTPAPEPPAPVAPPPPVSPVKEAPATFSFELVEVDAPAVAPVAALVTATPPLEMPKPVAPPRPAIPTALSEAATLHAEGKEIDAMRRLETALKTKENLGDSALKVWSGLFDLAQSLGRRSAFDSLAIAFAKRFERSPPAWIETSVGSSAVNASADAANAIALTGTLNATVAETLKQAMKLAQTSAEIHVDLSQLAGADNDGAMLLMRAVTGLAKAKKRVIFGNPGHLAQMLSPTLITGERKDEALWLLLLELYQQIGQQDPYEDAAVSYAVTFEVSPPAWVPPDPGTRAVPVKLATTVIAAKNSDEFELSGQLLNQSPEAFSSLDTLLASRDEVEINAATLLRIDPVSANHLLAAIERASITSKKIRITNLATLIAAYFEHLGFAEVAELHARKR